MVAPSPAPTPRIALLIGATGLVGGTLMAQLQASPRYDLIHVLVRRTAPRAGAEAKLQFHTVDFDQLPERLPPVDDVYIALGTTLKVAGSQDAFRHVDFDLVARTAQAARAAGARRLAVVSAHGADPKSSVFYSRIKGEMEAAVARIGFETIVIAQPSLLLGSRAALGQPTRHGEAWAQRLLGPIAALLPKRVRPIAAVAVASAMIEAILQGHAGIRFLSSARMQAR